MKTKLVLTCLVAGSLLGPGLAYAEEHPDLDRAKDKTVTFVKDSAITTKIKTKLAAEHFSSLGRIHVDTDKDGVVYLSGTAKTHEAAAKAEAIARDTEHVTAVHNGIRVRHDK